MLGYVQNKKEAIGLDSSDPEQAAKLTALQTENTSLRDKYYITEDIYSYDDLKRYLVNTDVKYDEKVLLRYTITLNRSADDKIKSVTENFSN